MAWTSVHATRAIDDFDHCVAVIQVDENFEKQVHCSLEAGSDQVHRNRYCHCYVEVADDEARLPQNFHPDLDPFDLGCHHSRYHQNR